MTSGEITRLYQFMMEEFATLRSEFRSEMAAGFAVVAARFDTTDARFDAIDVRFDAIKSNFDDLEVEQAAQNSQLNRLEDAITLLSRPQTL